MIYLKESSYNNKQKLYVDYDLVAQNSPVH